MEGGTAVKECVRALGAANLLGVGWPKEYGGRGFTALEQFIFFEEAQRVSAPHPVGDAEHRGAHAASVRHRGAEAEVPARDPGRHRGVRDRLFRTVARAAISRRCAPPPCATATTTSSTARRCSPAAPAYADYIWLAARTDPKRQEAQGHLDLHRADVARVSRANRCTPCRGSPLTTPSMTTCAYRRARRRRRERGMAADHHAAQLRTRGTRHMGALEPLFEKTLRLGHRHRDRRRPGHRSALGAAGARPRRGTGRRIQDHELRVNAAMTKGALDMGEASAVKVFGTELTQRGGPRTARDPRTATESARATDAPLRGALESAYRIAVINTFGGGANEIQRDIIAMAGLFMPRAPRDLRANQNGDAK